MRACRVRFLTSVPACRRIVCVRDRRVCAFSIVRCLAVSCAFAVTSLVRAQPSRVCVHERACASTSRVRVRRVRVDTSVMDLRSISGRYINKVYLNTYLNQYAHTYL